MGDVFDTAALKQAAEMPWPSESREQSRLWAQNSSDLTGAATYIEELEARVRELESATGYCERCEAAEARVTELEAALEQVKAQQPDTLAMIEANGFVFDSIGNEPGNWQHLAFTIYTDLCRVDTIAQSALAKEDTA